MINKQAPKNLDGSKSTSEENFIEQCMKDYVSYMNEIKVRTAVCDKIPDAQNRSLTGYKEADIDLLYLQIRKICELIMFACAVAHAPFLKNLNMEIRKGYSAHKIAQSFADFNPKFYPIPKVDVPYQDGIRNVIDKPHQDYLSKEDFIKTYNLTGNILHAQREYQYRNKDSLFNDGFSFCNKLKKLLSHHWIHVTDENAFAVIMKDNKTGNVSVSHMEKIKKGASKNKNLPRKSNGASS